ncbi:helix-turn-helix domain-containing protein [Sphingobacterium spiritivorum]|uniref:helix-turn-helix domain-containing protein n=1 Tax=Sphingobacterium spiritivorum TaxID=258 RepID=UPI003DA49314
MTDNQINKFSQKVDRLNKIIKESEFKSNLSFAKAIKMSPSYLSEVLNGKKDAPKYLGLKLEKFLNVNVEWYETGNGPVYSQPKEKSNFNFANINELDGLRNLISEKDKTITALLDQIKSKEEIIDMLKEQIAGLKSRNKQTG